MVSEPTGFVWNLVAMSHHEEETPKNESHKQEEHKMVNKTLSPYELNSNDNLRNLITQVQLQGDRPKIVDKVSQCSEWELDEEKEEQLVQMLRTVVEQV